MNTEIQKGQYWKDNNTRYSGTRIVIIVDIWGSLVRIKTITGSKLDRGYVRWTTADRFNGKGGGFTYLPIGKA